MHVLIASFDTEPFLIPWVAETKSKFDEFQGRWVTSATPGERDIAEADALEDGDRSVGVKDGSGIDLPDRVRLTHAAGAQVFDVVRNS